VKIPAETPEDDIFREARLYSINPLVGCIDTFVAANMVEKIESQLRSVKLEDAKTGSLSGAVVSDRRTAKNFKIRHDSIPVIDEVTEKIAKVFRLKKSHCEYPEYISYDEGKEFKRHFDAALSGSLPAWGNGEVAPSQRIFTGILYLNSDFDGGKTVFPRLGVELTPKLGRLAFWQNTKPGTNKVHGHSMHEGCPVTNGNKRIVSFWFRNLPWALEKAK